MGVKNTVFFLDLKTLDKKIDDNLKAFAKSEELEVDDIVKIIYNEAKRIGEKDEVKVTFKIVDGDEDSFRVIVEPANIKYKGTIIYPYEKVCSNDFEFKLDSVCGKITLYNKKKECRKITVTIENIALDIFAMTYQKAKEFLKDVSDRKEKKGYIEFPDAICFKQYGIKLNAKKAENGDIKVDELVASIDIFNKEEFFKEYYFEEEKEEEKYDVNIPLPDEYNYEKKKDIEQEKNITEESVIENIDIEIELPEIEQTKEDIKVEEPKFKIVEGIKEENNEVDQIDERQKELDRIREKQDAELEKVKDKLKRELEEELNKNIKKYDEDNEKRLKEDKRESNEEIENNIEIIPEIIVEEIPEKNELKIEEVKVEIDQENTKAENQKEIEELEELLKEERKQQEILENRIKSKLEELKSVASKSKEIKIEPKIDAKEPTEQIEIKEKNGFVAYEVESYKGIKEQGKENLLLYFGQSKSVIRAIFGGTPKEIRDYEEMELYDIFYAYYDEYDKCTGIGIYNQEVYKDKLALYMFGQNLITMKYRDIVKLIKKNDYNAIEDDDGIISLKYGISVDPKESSNYKDEISEVIHIFKKGYYDEVYENF